ncbi:unnamed protein product [Calicophoron daubneyi]|uniref:LIM zinc-binding domain-containing protein n=1 Tax=Calicophoron daubneyi TaxID=300641 RepID=A0AAV2TQ67_CALDB
MTVLQSVRPVGEQFDLFCAANSFSDILVNFNLLCAATGTAPTSNPWSIYRDLRTNLKSYWKAGSLFDILEKRVERPDYKHQTVCSGMNVLIVGCGPCGLRCAIELALLGARVVMVEKRESFSRNNVLHLWPYLIYDLRGLGAKTFFGKFCAGSIDHVSIRTLQCILLKVALLFGVQIFNGVTYQGLIEPTGDSTPTSNGERVKADKLTEVDSKNGTVENAKPERDHKVTNEMNTNGSKTNKGWGVRLDPEIVALKNFEIDVLIGADGKGSRLGFPSKQLRCRLAIAITANFINYHTPAEAQIEEISGVTCIFNQQFFTKLVASTGISLENIVYYKDETHYFVTTVKKDSLITKGVFKRDFEDSQSLLSPENVDTKALQQFARDIAQFATNGQLPSLEFALNSYGRPDVDIFDFTRMFAAEYSCRITERNQCLLLECLVGDGLYEPFWPTGSGCALGFLSALDAAWAVSLLGSGQHPFDVIAKRESVYQRLSQTTPQNMPPNFADYTLDPRTRYTGCNPDLFTTVQIRHLYRSDRSKGSRSHSVHAFKSEAGLAEAAARRLKERIQKTRSAFTRTTESFSILSTPYEVDLLRWLQFRLCFYTHCRLINTVSDLSPELWESGANLLCLAHLYRPDLIPEVESFLKSSSKLSDVAFLLCPDSHAKYPSPNLIRACELMAEHFNVEFGSHASSTTLPKSTTDWVAYLTEVYHSLKQLKIAGPPRMKGSTASDKLSGKKSSHLAVRDGSKHGTPSSRRAASIHKVLQPPVNSCLNEPKREDTKKSVEKGLLLKRRAELIAAVNDPASAKRRTPVPASLYQSEKAQLEKLTKQQKSTNSVIVPPSAPVPESIARLLASGKSTAQCYVCGKRLYLVERLMAFGLFFHRHCFRCSICGMQLQPDKATCVRATLPDETDKFFCPSHSQSANNDKPKVAKSQSTQSGASLTSRLIAGQFPFSSSSNPVTVDSIQAQQFVSTSAHNVGRDPSKCSRPQEQPFRSALLAGLEDDDEAVMGIVDLHPCALARGPHHQEESSSSSSSSSSSLIHKSVSKKIAGRVVKHTVGPSGDSAVVKIHGNGIRDEMAPGPDCYLAGHLGLSEVERRANWELNSSVLWPKAAIYETLEHMRMIRPYLLAADDYFASSESEPSPSSSAVYPITSAKDQAKTRVESRQIKVSRMGARKHRSQSSGSESSSARSNNLMIQSTTSDPILSNIGSSLLSLVSPLLSSPAHQNKLAAKQRFCMEPPKPLSIDPRNFIATRNLERTTTTVLADCSEECEYLEDCPISQPKIDVVRNEVKFSASDRGCNEILVMEATHPVGINEYHTSVSPPTSDAVSKASTTVAPDDSVLSGLAVGQNSNSNDHFLPSFTVNEDLRDIDSTSMTTDRSSCEVPTDECVVRSGASHKIADQAPHTGTRKKCSRSSDTSKARLDANSNKNPPEEFASSETSSTDLDSAPSIRQSRCGSIPQRLSFKDLHQASLDESHSNRLNSRFHGMPSSPTSYDEFRLRCAYQNRQAVELNRELKTLERTVRKLEAAGVKTEQELQAMDALINLGTQLPSHALAIGRSETTRNPKFARKCRSRTLNYKLAHEATARTVVSSGFAGGASEIDERKNHLLQRLAEIIATKKLLVQLESDIAEQAKCVLADDSSNRRICERSNVTRSVSEPDLLDIARATMLLPSAPTLDVTSQSTQFHGDIEFSNQLNE